ncbi:GAF domain-containing sensor histidine kinase [Salinimicrobium flavum]|uniref:histidine kinase n=1 Tax=Salinimicrobium flavum TaxID=1737065 RepID=A0ABW5IY42_9FLAO
MMYPDTVNPEMMEEERLAVLQKYEILDTPPDGSFDRITRLAAQLFDVPVSIVSLVDSDRIWFKSKQGLEISEIPRDPGLCSSAIISNEIYIVEDARKDPRTLANPLVAGEFGLQFYSGVPLRTREGFNLGTLCIIDREPREISASEKDILKTLGELVMNQIELQIEARKAVRHHHKILNTTAHDLKNPVAIMPLLADLIMDNKHNPAAIDDISKQIKDAGRRMAKTINDLLETAMEESGEIHLRLKAFDLSKLLKGVVESNRALARKKDQKIRFETKTTCKVYADHRRLTEVFYNIVNNAVKFSLPQTEVRVSLFEKEGMAVVRIEDEGPGLTKDDLNNLFRRFTSLSARPTGGETSSGLGLSIAREIVEAHDGQIYAESEGSEKGTCFTIQLPLAREQD